MSAVKVGPEYGIPYRNTAFAVRPRTVNGPVSRMSRLPRRLTVTQGRANLAHHGTVILTVTTPEAASSMITTSFTALFNR